MTSSMSHQNGNIALTPNGEIGGKYLEKNRENGGKMIQGMDSFLHNFQFISEVRKMMSSMSHKTGNIALTPNGEMRMGMENISRKNEKMVGK